MKAVILAAGYGTRLQRDLVADSSGRFAHLAGVAKPLLPVGRGALISHWVQALNRSGSVDRVYVVTNAVYRGAFEEWAAQYSNVTILSDDTRSNDERLGAVACLQLAIKHFGIEEDVLVIGGDTLFREDFSLSRIAARFSELQASCDHSCLVLSYRCGDEETRKYGILEVDGNLRVLRMKEKPDPSETSVRVSTCWPGAASLSWTPSLRRRRKQLLKRETLQATLCRGSLRGGQFTLTRSPGGSTLGTCGPTLNVTFTSGRDLETWSRTWRNARKPLYYTVRIIQKSPD
ncbi:glucose-1-phosphate thymidylyltransferase 2 isoform 1-T1 [Aulostomus maculatus]